jgi:hypothetical protein
MEMMKNRFYLSKNFYNGKWFFFIPAVFFCKDEHGSFIGFYFLIFRGAIRINKGEIN